MNDEDLDKINQLLKKNYTRGIYAQYAFTLGYAKKATVALELRLKLNLDDTGHPFHHKTQDGTIVEPDPALEHLFTAIPADDRELVIERWMNRIRPDAPAAKPVDRRHYGGDYYVGWQETMQDEELYPTPHLMYHQDLFVKAYDIAEPVESGRYEYLVYPANELTPTLTISSRTGNHAFAFTLKETLDLLRLLQPFESELEELLAQDPEEEWLNEEDEQGNKD
jgi:hypothetical protein